MSAHWVKIGLSLFGAILLIALCISMISDEETSESSSVFAAVFLILIVYALRRFMIQRKRSNNTASKD